MAVTCTLPTSSLTEPSTASVVKTRVEGSAGGTASGNGAVMPCTAIFQADRSVVQVPVGVSAPCIR